MKSTITICFFGYPNQEYSRSKILIDGLKKNNVSVVYCTDKSGFALTRYYRLFKKFIPLSSKCNAIFVQFPGQLNMPIAWILGKLFRKLVVYDAFVSMYDTYIFDREIASEDSFKAKFYFLVDKIACTLADIITLDTNAHIRYFVSTFNLKREKFFRVPVGGDDSLFKPSKRKKETNKTIIEFHGMFTKIHGAEIFVRVAKKLENRKNLEFWLIGSSHNYRLPIKLYEKLKPKNLRYWPRMQVKKLARKIAQADIIIGHLGPTQKAKMVLTNKMYHALACRVALIAGKCSASDELLTNGQDCQYVNLFDEQDLQEKIIKLARNKRLRQKLAKNGHKLHQQKFTNEKLGKSLKMLIVTNTHSSNR